MFLDQYTYGILVCYTASCLVWAYLAAFNFKWRIKRFVGCVMISMMFAFIVYDQYTYFIVQDNILSENLMFTRYFKAICALVGSGFIWYDRG